MHPINTAILEQFRRNPSKQYKTTDIVGLVFSQEYKTITNLLHSQDKANFRRGLQQKAQLHRKLLYHINKLVEKKLLLVTDVCNRGEKTFSLSMEQGELLIKDKQHQIVISKLPSLGSSLDRYQTQSLIVKHKSDTWLSKQQAIMLDGYSIFSVTELLQKVKSIIPICSDVLAINRFESVIAKASHEEIVLALQSLSYESDDYFVNISLLINLDRISNSNFLSALNKTMSTLSRKITFVFTITPRTISSKESEIKNLLLIFSRNHRPINFKNQSIFQAPIFYGGTPYAIVPNDYNTFKDRIRGITNSCVISNLGVVIDIKHHFEKGGSISDFRQLIQKVCHGLFEADEQKRKLHRDTHNDLEQAKAHFRITRHYIRFWNWQLLEEGKEFTFDLLESIAKDIESFCDRQEAIFRSCGLPVRFRIALGSAFKDFDSSYFSEKWLRFTTISQTSDLQTKRMKKYLHLREKLFTLFDGADRVRFFVDPGTTHQELLSMTRHLLNAHNLPLITFNFRGKSGDLTLNQFLGDLDG